jgi:hypothetical protein
LWLGFSASVSGFEIKVPDALLAKLRGQELMKKQRAKVCRAKNTQS